MVLYHQLLCGAEDFFSSPGQCRVGANEYGRPQISIDKSVRGYKRGCPSPSFGYCILAFHPVHAPF